MNFLPVVILYLEVVLLAFAERKLWNTWFTPLNCLSVPYALVLALALCFDGRMGFVPFYYPSIWVWVVGLAVFFVPSCILGLLQRRKNQSNSEVTMAQKFTISSFTLRILEYITWSIFALFLFWFFYLKYAKGLIPGGENFAQAWASHGFFGHLSLVLMGLNIFWLFSADKEHKRYWLYVLGFFGVALLYLSKCWFLIPMAAGLLLRLLTGKTKFGIKVVLVSVFTSLAFFFATYWLTLYVAYEEKLVEAEIAKKSIDIGVEKKTVEVVEKNPIEVAAKEKRADIDVEKIKQQATEKKQQKEFKVWIISFISRHAVTYMVAGVYGLSEDLAQNTIEEKAPEKIFAPFINIGKRFTGNRNYVSNLNDKFVKITTNDEETNVRTFFGTLYVFSGFWHALAYVLVFSCFLYGMFTFALKTGKLFLLGILCWFASSMLMGWFDIITNTFAFVVVPCYLAVIFGLCFLGKKINPSWA